VRQVLEESGALTPPQIEQILDLRRWTEPGLLDRHPES